MKINFNSIIELVEFFKTEEICVKFLKDVKKCPHCGDCEVMGYKDYRRNRYKACKRDFSIKQGTIFKDSNVTLKKWFMVMYIFNAHKKGISGCQLARGIGVSQPTSWFILQRLRYASKDIFKKEFERTVEVHEAYIAGREGNRHSKQRKLGIKEKIVVIGLVNRETGLVKTAKVPSAEKEWLLLKINVNVKKGSTILTDTCQSYKNLKRNYKHKTVKHSAGQYVKNDARVALRYTLMLLKDTGVY